jgi:signal transduction histidine kinase
MRLSQNSYILLNRLPHIILLIYQAMAVGVFLLALILGLRWMPQPFLGAFYEQTLVFNGVRPGQSNESWNLYNQGVRLGDQLISVNGVKVHSTGEVQKVLDGTIQGMIPTTNGFVPGETIPLTIRTANGEERTLDVELHIFPTQQRISYFVIPMFASAIFMAIGLLIFALRRLEPAGQAFALLAASLAILAATSFDLFTTHYLTYLWTLALAVCGGALVSLALSLPQEVDFVVRRPYLRWVGLIVALVLTLMAYNRLFNFERPTSYMAAWRVLYIFVGLSALFFLMTSVYYGTSALSPVVKTQARTILGGALLGLGPLFIWLITTPIHLFEFTSFLFLPIILFLLTLGYTILRFRLPHIDEWLRRGLVYVLLTIMAVLGYALLVTGIGLIFSNITSSRSPLWVGVIIFLIAIALDPVRSRLQEYVDMTFFRGQRAYMEKLQGFSRKLTTTLDLKGIGGVLRDEITSSLSPDRIHVYTYDALNDQYFALPGRDGRLSSDIRFPASSPLALYLNRERLPLFLHGASLPASLETEQSRLTLLGARLFVVLPHKERLNGWLALGSLLSGEPYTPRDLSFLENLCSQTSVAIERFQMVANLERRIQEMNALTRVSQGVNVTLSFDDVLELIYAQTAQIIPCSHFHITLYNKDNDYYYYAFCVENNERLSGRENIQFPAFSGLGPEVCRSSSPILTQDYTRECLILEAVPVLEKVHAWLGVPLNAGAETIGALSVGNREAGTIYSRGQLELLQAIADQTAGAIVKARLLQETQQRAQQLSSLNEITRQLTSTLELEPLLQNILENAVNLINCEAGTLFLIDELTDELISKVTVGPVVANKVGQRLPPGTSIVGRVVQTRTPLIENEPQGSPDGFNSDKQAGFVSHSMLAAPLQAKARVIGVLEVINRRDGLPFGEEDQTLLMAFAGQGAVAIENARLYTLTDQELTARVEELSVMQRIDRELNASLEMERAMRITLEWALRQTQAEAGLIGMLEQDKLLVIAQQGYDDRLANLPEQTLKLELPAMQAAVESGQSQRVVIRRPEEGWYPSAYNQLAIPIRRETQVIGLLFLESTRDSHIDLAFLNRLSDHAAIAISNAQLYGEVQRANLAKSDFVSLVAHELKNPMTSIKGYTELLAGGAVGQINDMQANFLNTIRSNVDRMSTLVSDLNDDSKIEADRLRLEYKAVDIAEVLDEVVRSLKRQIDDKKQTLNLQLPDHPQPVWADRTRLAQVLTNLVNNAYKYTMEGGHIEIGAMTSSNQWDVEGPAQVLHIWVQDTGIGINTEDQTKVFQKFFRSEDSKVREVAGTGLGLNITKSLVEMQGGRIWFESEFRKGTTFHFTIPVTEG